jgi:hypothetical protein
MTKIKQLASSSGGFLKALISLLKTLIDYMFMLNRRWNEAWLIVLGFLAFKYQEHVLALLDPTATALPANDLVRFLYATIGTCIAHFVVTLMLRLSHPWIFKYLYARFYQDLYEKDDDNLKSHSIKHDLKCLRLKYSLLVLLFYLGTWLILAATY